MSPERYVHQSILPALLVWDRRGGTYSQHAPLDVTKDFALQAAAIVSGLLGYVAEVVPVCDGRCWALKIVLTC